MSAAGFQLSLEAGIATVTLDVPCRSMNVLTEGAAEELAAILDLIDGDPDVRGVLLVSGKENGFCAGADLTMLSRLAENGSAELPPIGKVLRRLETGGRPVAAALEGLALGGGLELALAAHYRVAASAPGLKLGLPEVTVGLLPGAGGTQRLPRLIGVAAALPMLLRGKPIDGAGALATGLIDALVDPGETMAAARAWLLSNAANATARWDEKGYRPRDLPFTPQGAALFTLAAATLAARTHGSDPAAENILRAVFEGIQLPIDRALEVEARYFRNTLATPQAAARIAEFFAGRRAPADA